MTEQTGSPITLPPDRRPVNPPVPEQKRAILTPVLDKMKALIYKDDDNTQVDEAKLAKITADLNKQHEKNPEAGIAIIDLEGIEVETEDGKYHFHAARVFESTEGNPSFVNPHKHKKGEEPYLIIAGQDGEINLGREVEEEVEGVIKRVVIWDGPRRVKAGEIIIVEEEQVHSLRNTSGEPMDFIFACPDSHLVDNSAMRPDGDRYLVAKLLPKTDGRTGGKSNVVELYVKNGVPAHFPVTQLPMAA